jgi:hypothetical protein
VDSEKLEVLAKPVTAFKQILLSVWSGASKHHPST